MVLGSRGFGVFFFFFFCWVSAMGFLRLLGLGLSA